MSGAVQVLSVALYVWQHATICTGRPSGTELKLHHHSETLFASAYDATKVGTRAWLFEVVHCTYCAHASLSNNLKPGAQYPLHCWHGHMLGVACLLYLPAVQSLSSACIVFTHREVTVCA